MADGETEPRVPNGSSFVVQGPYNRQAAFKPLSGQQHIAMGQFFRAKNLYAKDRDIRFRA
ncbi:hypothetical protein FOZG_02141 [Fusarium oxysporum Fo47]|uniref:Uncharacterized protein n=1 Tax=Fusarium oxysporum Fo47 TaxID=660027 RepID=W9LH43_FUSOX|nr:hypothetical protein FOZG_02141 [Fusarium oxysporum Fo47]